jgi:hypothetical protein
MAQQAFIKPKAGLLTPHVAQIVADILAEVSREDTIPVAEYIEMLQTSPVIGAAVELKVLIALQKMGQYSNTEDKYQKFILKNFEMMRGSLQLSIMELYSVGPIGFACAEWAPIQRDGSWMLDRIQILDPRKYTFYGKGGEVEHLLYEGEAGDIIVPYDRVIHLTNQAHIAFGSVYGVAECKRAYAAYKAWKIVVAAALIAARRRGEPIMIGFADPSEQVSIGTNDDGSIAYVNGTQALADSLQDLENNSVMATSVANRVEMIEAAEGDLILSVLKVLEQYQLLAFLVPESILTATGVGDSNLNTGHRSTLDATITATVNQIKERLIEDVVRPLLAWEFGENVESFGEFAVGDAQPEDGAIDILKVLIDAVYNNVFSAQDLDVINRMRTLAGLPSVTEIAQGLDAPPDDGIEDVADDGAIEDVAADDAPIEDATTDPAATDAASVQFAAAPKATGRGGKGRKKGQGQKNCKKGTNCGGTCISAKKTCRKDNPSAKVKAKAKSKGGGGGGGSGSEQKTELSPWQLALTPEERKEFSELVRDTQFGGFSESQEMVRSGAAKSKAGTGSNKEIDEALVIQRDGLEGFTAKDLDRALDSIPGGQKRIGKLRQFVNDQQIKVIFNDRRGVENNAEFARKIGQDPYYVQAFTSALGYTSAHLNHVVVVPGAGLKYDKFNSDRSIKAVTSSAKKPLSKKPFGGDDGELYTYLHEVGHQVEFKSRLVDRRSGRSVDPLSLAPTRYGATNKEEAFAESFALYMMHGDKYAKAHPESAKWVQERIDWVTTP